MIYGDRELQLFIQYRRHIKHTVSWHNFAHNDSSARRLLLDDGLLITTKLWAREGGIKSKLPTDI